MHLNLTGLGLEEAQDRLSGNMIDITAPEIVEVSIRPDGKVLWINVNGICVLRACNIGTLIAETPLHPAE